MEIQGQSGGLFRKFLDAWSGVGADYCAGSTGRSVGEYYCAGSVVPSAGSVDARAREDENARARERLRGKKRGGKCGVRMREGKMMEEQGSVEQVRGVCGGLLEDWEESKRSRESTGGKVL